MSRSKPQTRPAKPEPELRTLASLAPGPSGRGVRAPPGLHGLRAERRSEGRGRPREDEPHEMGRSPGKGHSVASVSADWRLKIADFRIDDCRLAIDALTLSL